MNSEEGGRVEGKMQVLWEEGGVWGQAVLGSVPAQSLKEGDRPPRFARTEGVGISGQSGRCRTVGAWSSVSSSVDLRKVTPASLGWGERGESPLGLCHVEPPS